MLVIVLGAAALAVVSAIRLLAPPAVAWIDALGPGLAGRVLPDAVCAALGVGAGLAGIAIGVLGHVARMSPPSPALRAGAVTVTIALILLTPGGLIPVAGYTFALVVLLGAIVMLALLVRRHPWWGLAVLAGLAGALTWAVVNMHGAVLAAQIVASLGEILPAVLLAAAYLLVAVALIVWTAISARVGRGSVARWVLRHRTAITVVAACCALPYAFARATWLTPWPLLAPDHQTLVDAPMAVLTGLSLGAAMLAGGLLTLGLIMPWGRTFPRWMAVLGGRAVPVALAVVPASVVAALFTAGGVDMFLSVLDGSIGGGGLVRILELTLVFPFWLWGPMLALATWGYAMARLDEASTTRLAR